MNKFWEKFFYLLTYLSQGPSFLNPRSYAVLHRKHHQHSDQEQDPHSPYNFTGLIPMMLSTYKTYQHLQEETLHNPDKYQINSVPKIDLIDRLGRSTINVFIWPLLYGLIYYSLDVSWWYYPLIVVHSFLGPIQGAIVNWCGHKFGSRNYDTPDKSKNTFKQDLLLMGELYQNNHHYNGQKMNFAHKWYEIDLTYLIGQVLAKLKIIRIESWAKQ